MKLTPQQKEEKKQRDILLLTHNRCRSAFSFKTLKTLRDLLKLCGYSDEHINNSYTGAEQSCVLTFRDIESFFEDRRIELETSIWLRNNPPRITYTEEEKSILPRATEHVMSNVMSAEQQEVEEQKKDYGIVPSPNEKAFLYWFQKKTIADLWESIIVQHMRSKMVIGGTGVGKTFIIGAFLRRLVDIKWHKQFTKTPIPYVYVTRANVVDQTKYVLEHYFGLTSKDVLVINYDALRSSFGTMYIDEKLVINHGRESVKYVWRDFINPLLIIWDECHALKNEDTLQSQIGQAFNELESITYQLFFSATPFSKVCEAKCFAVSTRANFKFGIANEESPLTNERWNNFASYIAAPADPAERSPAAVERLVDYLDKYIHRVKGVRWQFNAINRTEAIDFETEADAEFYAAAYEKYLQKKAKIEAMEGLSAGQSRFMILVEMLVFRQAAELCRARFLAKKMWETVFRDGKAAVCALNFKPTISKVVKILMDNYNVSRDEISLIWGGGVKAPTKKQKLKAALLDNKEAMDALAAAGFSMKDIDLDDIEAQAEKDYIDPRYRLGAQTAKHRREEHLKFQKGKSLYCFYTFKMGVGISLHHTDEYTEFKVRHKESGYAVEEDIPKVPTRQRVCFLAPTWSPIELVQGTGRVPRLTSLSDSEQIMYYYRGTIEVRVAKLVGMSLRCLSKVVKQKEAWDDLIVGHYTDEQVEQKFAGIKDDTIEETITDVNEDEDEE